MCICAGLLEVDLVPAALDDVHDVAVLALPDDGLLGARLLLKHALAHEQLRRLAHAVEDQVARLAYGAHEQLQRERGLLDLTQLRAALAHCRAQRRLARHSAALACHPQPRYRRQRVALRLHTVRSSRRRGRRLA
eukprot:scaffold53629_cov39-Phaeocystis_antarctica.AAC.2